MADQNGAKTTLNEMFSQSKEQEIWVKLNLSNAVKKLSAVDIVEISEENDKSKHPKYNVLSDTDKGIVQALILLYDNKGLINSGTIVDNPDYADIHIKKFPNNFAPRAYWGAKRLPN